MIDSYLNELKTIRDWTQRAEEDLNKIACYGLPIVSPLRDLALPGSLILEKLSKYIVPEDPKLLVSWNQQCDVQNLSLNQTCAQLNIDTKPFPEKVSLINKLFLSPVIFLLELSSVVSPAIVSLHTTSNIVLL